MSRQGVTVLQLIVSAKQAAMHALASDELVLIPSFRKCDARGKRNTVACVLGEVEDSLKLRPRLTLAHNRGHMPEAKSKDPKGHVDMRKF